MVAVPELAPLTDPLAWIVVLSFAGSAVLAWRDSPYRRHAFSATWGLFGIFWALMIPHYAIEMRSIVEGLLSAIAVPASLYVGYLTWTERRSFEVLGRAIAVMGLIYLPFEAIPLLRRNAIELVVQNVEAILHLYGFDPAIESGPDALRNTFAYVTAGSGHPFTTEVILACTGIGSISIVVGLVMAVGASLRRKLLGIGIAVPVIYGLNVLRVAFITLASRHQWFAAFKRPVFLVFGIEDPYLVSYIVADRIISQSASVVALVLITLGLLRLLPELATIVEDVLFLLTGREYDLERSN
ncbi:MAG: archaeosortase A [Halodesulfurarchaeum sp.]